VIVSFDTITLCSYLIIGENIKSGAAVPENKKPPGLTSGSSTEIDFTFGYISRIGFCGLSGYWFGFSDIGYIKSTSRRWLAPEQEPSIFIVYLRGV